VERVIGPDSTILLDYALVRLTRIIKNLVVYPKNMLKNLDLTRGLIFSQQVLLALAQAGASREEAYSLVQSKAMAVWEDPSKDFKELLLQDGQIGRYLDGEAIGQIFDLDYHLKHVDTIFDRVFA
jgi:adenylosuccinate lyase